MLHLLFLASLSAWLLADEDSLYLERLIQHVNTIGTPLIQIVSCTECTPSPCVMHLHLKIFLPLFQTAGDEEDI